MAVAHDTGAAVRQLQVPQPGDKYLNLGGHHLSQHAAGAFAGEFSQGIIDSFRLTEAAAADTSLNTISRAVRCDSDPFVRTVR
jgi:hypothetical protein